MPRLVIGVDVGLSGALAALGSGGLVGVADMPVMARGAGAGRVKRQVDPAALAELLTGWADGGRDEVLVVVERVASMPGQGVASMLSLGDSLGCVRGIIAAKRYPLAWVTAREWKARYRLGADKELSRARAIELYPGADLAWKKDHGRAEAILIARYGWEALR